MKLLLPRFIEHDGASGELELTTHSLSFVVGRQTFIKKEFS
jgi:hypothetical protein